MDINFLMESYVRKTLKKSITKIIATTVYLGGCERISSFFIYMQFKEMNLCLFNFFFHKFQVYVSIFRKRVLHTDRNKFSYFIGYSI